MFRRIAIVAFVLLVCASGYSRGGEKGGLSDREVIRKIAALNADLDILDARRRIADLPILLAEVAQEKMPFWDALFHAMRATAEGKFDDADEDFKQIAEHYPREKLGEDASVFMQCRKGVLAYRKGEFREAQAALDRIQAEHGKDMDPFLAGQVLAALLAKGRALYHMGDVDSALAALDKVAASPVGRDDPETLSLIGQALLEKGAILENDGYHGRAVEVFDNAIGRLKDGKKAFLFEQRTLAMANKAGSLASMGDGKAALQLLSDTKAEYARINAEQPEWLRLQKASLEIEAKKMTTPGDISQESLETVKAFDRIIGEAGGRGDVESKRMVAEALLNKAQAYVAIGQKEAANKGVSTFIKAIGAAVDALNDLVTRFKAEKDPELRRCVARALLEKARHAQFISGADAMLRTYDRVVFMYGGADDPKLLALVARAMVAQAEFLSSTSTGSEIRRRETLRTIDSLLERFKGRSEPDIREQVAAGMRIQAFVYSLGGDTAKEAEIRKRIIEMFKDSDSPALQAETASAMLRESMASTKDDPKSIRKFEEIVTRYGTSEDPRVEASVANAIFFKGMLEEKTGSRDKAIASFNELIRRYATGRTIDDQENAPLIFMTTAQAMLAKARIYLEMRDGQKALAALDDLIAAFGDFSGYDPQYDVAACVAEAMSMKAVTLFNSEDRAGMMRTLDAVIAKYKSVDNGKVRRFVGEALLAKGYQLLQDGDKEGARKTYRELVEVFKGEPSDPYAERFLKEAEKRLESLK